MIERLISGFFLNISNERSFAYLAFVLACALVVSDQHSRECRLKQVRGDQFGVLTNLTVSYSTQTWHTQTWHMTQSTFTHLWTEYPNPSVLQLNFIYIFIRLLKFITEHENHTMVAYIFSLPMIHTNDHRKIIRMRNLGGFHIHDVQIYPEPSKISLSRDLNTTYRSHSVCPHLL